MLDTRGATLLHNACLSGNVEWVKKLVEKYGADVNANGIPALNPASVHPRINPWAPAYPCPNNLLGVQAPIEGTPLDTCLRSLSNPSAAIEIMDYLIKHGADVNSGTAGQTALMRAVKFSARIDVIRFLLDNGAQVNKQDAFGWSTNWL
jgi:ankyrin repeat protein